MCSVLLICIHLCGMNLILIIHISIPFPSRVLRLFLTFYVCCIHWYIMCGMPSMYVVLTTCVCYVVTSTLQCILAPPMFCCPVRWSVKHTCILFLATCTFIPIHTSVHKWIHSCFKHMLDYFNICCASKLVWTFFRSNLCRK